MTYQIIIKVYEPLTVVCSAESVSTPQQYLHTTSHTDPTEFRLDEATISISPNSGTVHNTTFQVDEFVLKIVQCIRRFYFDVSQF